MKKETAIVPVIYEQLSQEFKEALTQYQTSEARSVKLFADMFRVLIQAGYTKSAALNKIKADHENTPGYSERNMRRHIPEDLKNQSHSQLVKKGMVGKSNQSDKRLSDQSEKPTIIQIKAETIPSIPDSEAQALAEFDEKIAPVLQEMTVRLDMRKWFGYFFAINQKHGKTDPNRPIWLVCKVKNGEIGSISEQKPMEVTN